MLPALLIAALVVIGIGCAIAYTRYDDRKNLRPPRKRTTWSTPADTGATAASLFAADVADGGGGGHHHDGGGGCGGGGD